MMAIHHALQTHRCQIPGAGTIMAQAPAMRDPLQIQIVRLSFIERRILGVRHN